MDLSITTAGGLDLSVVEGDIVESDGIPEAVATTLFCHASWWGNEILRKKIGGEASAELERPRSGEAAEKKLVGLVSNDLAWVTREGVAATVQVDFVENKIAVQLDGVKVADFENDLGA